MRLTTGILLASTLLAGPVRASEPPSRLKVLALSLVLPGLGHVALGQATRAEAFMAGEGALWSTYGAFRIQGHLRKNSYIEMAGIFAGVPKPKGRSDEYYRLVGQYHSSDDYDVQVRMDARAYYGDDDLAGRAAYYEANKIPDDQVWNWQSSADWLNYQKKRSDSLLSYQRARYMIGLAIANRLLAGLDAMRLVHLQEDQRNVGFYLWGDPSDPGEPIRFCVSLSLP